MSAEVFALAVAILVLFLIAAFVLFDLLVRRLYSHHRSSWETEGKPQGMIFVPPEARRGLFVRLGSSWAMLRASFVWLFNTPDWARGDPIASKMMLWWRITGLAWVIGFASMWPSPFP